MNISYYYHILDIGILYEKGRQTGRNWKRNERKRLQEECMFWQNVLDFIDYEENGIKCSKQLFEHLEKLCEKYKLPNYKSVLEKKEELIADNDVFERNKEESLKIYHLMKQLLLEMQKNLEDYKDKEIVYRILSILHNLPKAMHGQNILNNNCNVISCANALKYAQGYMTKEMKEKYKKYFD